MRDGAFAPPAFSLDFSPPVVTITTMHSKHIIKQLEAAGWVLRGVRGRHHLFTHPAKPGHLSVPHPKDLGVGLTHKLLKQAGLKYKERGHEIYCGD